MVMTSDTPRSGANAVQQQTGTVRPDRIDLGRVVESATAQNAISFPSQPRDIYSFSMPGGSLKVTLSDVADNAKVILRRERGPNGVSTPDDTITESRLSSSGADQTISLDGLGVGRYQLHVGTDKPVNLFYTLTLNVRPGVRDFESEPNNSFFFPNKLDDDGRVNLTGSRLLRGALNDEDTTDVWRFKTAAISRFVANVSGLSADAEVNLSILGADISDPQRVQLRTETQNGTAFISSDRLPIGTYFASLSNKGRTQTAYNLSLSAIPVQRAEFSVTIRRIRALDDFEGFGRGEADFYARLTINGVTHQTEDISNQDDVRPNFRFSRDVGITQEKIPFAISIRESDGRFDPTGDGHADINSSPGIRDLNLTYDPTTGTVSGEDVTRTRRGTFITRGDGDGDRAFVEFSVDYVSTL